MSERSNSPMKQAIRQNIFDYGWAYFVSTLIFGMIILLGFVFWFSRDLAQGHVIMPLLFTGLVFFAQCLFVAYVFSVGSERHFKMGFALSFGLGAILGGGINAALLMAGLEQYWSYILSSIFIFGFGLVATTKFYPSTQS